MEAYSKDFDCTGANEETEPTAVLEITASEEQPVESTGDNQPQEVDVDVEEEEPVKTVITIENMGSFATNDLGSCPPPVGTVPEFWQASFGFPVPGFAPDFLYVINVTAYKNNGMVLWTAYSEFYID